MAGAAAQERLFEHLAEVLRAFGTVERRRMFGGLGVYHQGLIFGLVIGQSFYLKTDEQSRPAFVAAGSVPFQYEKAGKTTQTSYYTMPAEAFDDPALARQWAMLAYAAALRAQRRPAKRRPKA